MMVKFSRIINPLILDAGWVGFMGDSEYFNEDDELMMGYWQFIDILDDAPTDNDWDMDDEIDDSVLYEEKWAFKVINSKGQVCVVKFKY